MSLWRNRGFLKLWTGQTISEIGSRISREGLPLTAVLVLGASPAQMGVLSAMGGIAAMAAAPIAGVVADRFAHRPILIASDVGRALLLSLIPYCAATHRLTMAILLTIASLVGALTVFFDVHYQAFLPRLVKPDELLEGNQKLALTSSTAEVLGPGITGILVQTLTAPIAILFDAISFLISAASIALIRNEAIPVRTPHAESEFAGAWGGFRYVAGHPILRALLLRNATAMFFGGFIGSMYVLYAIREVGLNPAQLGVVIMLGGIANLTGAVLAEKVGRRWTPGTILVGTALLSGAAAMLIPLATSPWWYGALLLGGSQLLGDISYPLFGIVELTARQRLTRPELIGRVNGCVQLFTKGLLPLGALTAGLLAERSGLRFVMLVGCSGVLASAGWLIFSPVRHLQPFDTPGAASVN